MLNEVKKSLESYANLYLPSNWKEENKNNLFRNYIKNEKDQVLKAAYLSAILYRYWPKLERFYIKSKSSATPEEAYDWLTGAALYTLEKRMWENPKASIYKDPNGPDKVMNTMVKSFRLGHYERTNTQKRKEGINSLSLESLEEDKGDYYTPIEYDKDLSLIEDSVNEIIIKSFKKRDYFTSFMAFNIVYQDVFNNNKFNEKKLNSLMRHMDDKILNIFSEMYKFPIQEVKDAFKTFSGLSNRRIYNAIRRNLNILAKKEYPHLIKE